MQLRFKIGQKSEESIALKSDLNSSVKTPCHIFRVVASKFSMIEDAEYPTQKRSDL
jgi:hypothetical protein